MNRNNCRKWMDGQLDDICLMVEKEVWVIGPLNEVLFLSESCQLSRGDLLMWTALWYSVQWPVMDKTIETQQAVYHTVRKWSSDGLQFAFWFLENENYSLQSRHKGMNVPSLWIASGVFSLVGSIPPNIPTVICRVTQAMFLEWHVFNAVSSTNNKPLTFIVLSWRKNLSDRFINNTSGWDCILRKYCFLGSEDTFVRYKLEVWSLKVTIVYQTVRV